MTTEMTDKYHAEIVDAVDRARDEIGKVIVGQAELVDTTLLAILCEGHVLLEGVPGLGKTKLLQTLGQVLDVAFGRIQFTPDLMPADILGTNLLRGDGFEFQEGPLFANLVLADEINRATPKTQSALLEAMQERAATLAGVTHQLPRPFFVMATQNPIEMEGTYPLPEAQLDRFLFKITVPFPEVDDMVEIMRRTTTTEEAEPRSVLSRALILDAGRAVRSVPAGEHLLGYVARIVAASHPESPYAPERVREYVRYGASPRGAQALVLGGKARALLDGRPNLAVEDIAAIAPFSLRHRLVLGYEAIADEITVDEIIEDILKTHPEPVVTGSGDIGGG